MFLSYCHDSNNAQIGKVILEQLLTAQRAASAEAAINPILDCILPPRIRFRFPVHVKGLASTIYEKRDWLLMPVLADALEEIGQAEMAAHCRCPIHVKGCHVLDSLLGRR